MTQWRDSFGTTPGALNPSDAQKLGASIKRLLPPDREGKVLETREDLPSIEQKKGVGRQDSPSGADSTGGGGVPVKITSNAGAIDKYYISVYANGATAAPTETGVLCTQLQISGTVNIPNDTWTIATKINGNYYMQVPIWLISS